MPATLSTVAALGQFRTPPIGQDGLFVLAWNRWFQTLEVDRQNAPEFLFLLSADRPSTDPTKVGIGTLYYETDTGKIYISDGTQWRLVSVPLPSAVGPKSQIFTSSGTFTIPAGITEIKVTVVGGGGGGGGGSTTVGSGGGSSGSAGLKWLSGLTPGLTLTVTIGPGGGGGAINTSGASGTGSSVSSGTQSITSIVTNGGQGGAITGAGFSVSAGTGGDINLGGGPAQQVDASAQANGTAGGNSIFSGAGTGANGGGQSASANSGSGGGAGGSNGGAGSTGGNGGAGIAIFEWVG